MDAVEQARMAEMEETYWWHVGRRHIIRRTLERYVGPSASMDIVDVGCGSGRNLELLDQFGKAIGVECAGPGLDACRARGLGPDRVAEGPATALPFPDGSFDLACAFDVLEHLDDDAAGLAEMRRVLRPSGLVLLTVPAYRFLWSVHDEALGHRRRYVASELHSLLNRGGFSIIRRSYAISMALLPIIAFRIAQGLDPTSHEKGASYVEVPEWINNLLITAIKIESKLMKAIDLPAGASIIALARRTD
jgi:SAM-dependent methyltransferase